MNLDLYKSELCLTDNAPMRLLSARGVRITCTAGLVWLTVEGEAGDIFLAPGQSHLVRGRGSKTHHIVRLYDDELCSAFTVFAPAKALRPTDFLRGDRKRWRSSE